MSAGLLANEISVDAFPTPPTGFEPRGASNLDLKRFGIPLRPATTDSPEYRLHWQRMFSRPAKFMVPRFKPRASRRVSAAVRKPAAVGVAHDIQYTTWAGYAIESAQTPLIAVAGTWTIPNLDVPPNLQGDVKCVSSAWIGIDGYGGLSPDILQAGVDFTASRQSGVLQVTASAWWEWYSGDSYYFDFPVAPGDAISCNITSTAGGTTGIVYMANLVNGRHITMQIPAPQDVRLAGNCAEWIVERLTETATSEVPTPLPDFGTVFFDNAFAATVPTAPTPQQTRLACDGTPITMIETDSTTLLTRSTPLGPATFRIDRL